MPQDKNRCLDYLNAVINFPVPLNSGKIFSSCEPVSISRRTLLHAVGLVGVLVG